MKDGLDKDRTFSKTRCIREWSYVKEDLKRGLTSKKDRHDNGQTYVTNQPSRQQFNQISA